MSTIAHHTLNIQSLVMAGMQEYGALVKRARESQGLTQDEAGRLMGRPHTFLVRIENGRNSNPPDPETMRAIWRVFGISLRTQLESIGYLDPEAPEPGIAYAVPEGSARAELLDALLGASDDDVATITAIARLVPMAGLQGRAGMAQSTKGPQATRSA